MHPDVEVVGPRQRLKNDVLLRLLSNEGSLASQSEEGCLLFVAFCPKALIGKVDGNGVKREPGGFFDLRNIERRRLAGPGHTNWGSHL